MAGSPAACSWGEPTHASKNDAIQQLKYPIGGKASLLSVLVLETVEDGRRGGLLVTASRLLLPIWGFSKRHQSIPWGSLSG